MWFQSESQSWILCRGNQKEAFGCRPTGRKEKIMLLCFVKYRKVHDESLLALFNYYHSLPVIITIIITTIISMAFIVGIIFDGGSALLYRLLYRYLTCLYYFCRLPLYRYELYFNLLPRWSVNWLIAVWSFFICIYIQIGWIEPPIGGLSPDGGDQAPGWMCWIEPRKY